LGLVIVPVVASGLLVMMITLSGFAIEGTSCNPYRHKPVTRIPQFHRDDHRSHHPLNLIPLDLIQTARLVRHGIKRKQRSKAFYTRAWPVAGLVYALLPVLGWCPFWALT
jgi:hypothetical protein